MMACNNYLRLEALKPVAGEPTGQVSNSHGSVKGTGVVVIDPFPDCCRAGADKTV